MCVHVILGKIPLAIMVFPSIRIYVYSIIIYQCTVYVYACSALTINWNFTRRIAISAVAKTCSKQAGNKGIYVKWKINGVYRACLHI